MRSIDRVARSPIGFDSLPNDDDVMETALRHRLTFYDAAYLELAMREAMPLATLDTALARAAEAERIPLLAP